jgi:hypothetical protein
LTDAASLSPSAGHQAAQTVIQATQDAMQRLFEACNGEHRLQANPAATTEVMQKLMYTMQPGLETR